MTDAHDISEKVSHLLPEKCSRDHKRTTVRFTDEEYERIIEEAQISGLSVPAILKASHFRRRKLKLLFDEVSRKFICSELRKIGNNINQIAFRVNSGVLEGWYDDFSKVNHSLTEIYQMVVEVYGDR